jgi:hypothetical protein
MIGNILRRMILKRVIHGVDKNPMAVELAKVALWLHTFTVGAPLSFLDHHLKCGDSLFGEWVRPVMDKIAKWGGELLINNALQRAQGSARGMSAIENLTDAELAEAKQSASLFFEVAKATAPLASFMSLIHALEWLSLGDKDDKAAVRAWLDGVFRKITRERRLDCIIDFFNKRYDGTLFFPDVRPLDGQNFQQKLPRRLPS